MLDIKWIQYIDFIQKFFSALQSATVFAAAIFAGIKFRIFRAWHPTQKSEMLCNVTSLAPNSFVFEAEYQVFNTGDRPMLVRYVILKLCHAKLEKAHYLPDPDNQIVWPTVMAKTKEEAERLAGSNIVFKNINELGYVNKGTYSSFTLRCHLDRLPDVMFVLGEFSWSNQKRTFSEMWVNDYSKVPSAPKAATATG